MGVFKKEIQVNCPIEGKVYPLEYCPDEVFSKGMTGEGVVIFPTGNRVVAPIDGKINFIFSSKHAIHVGLDTNQLNGDGFKIFVDPDQVVKQGDILLTFDSEILKKHRCIDATPFVFTNLNRKNITVNRYGMVNLNEPFIIVERG